MERFFTDAFTAMSDTDKESFYKTVIFHDTSDYAAAKSSIRNMFRWVTTLPFPMT